VLFTDRPSQKSARSSILYRKRLQRWFSRGKKPQRRFWRNYSIELKICQRACRQNVPGAGKDPRKSARSSILHTNWADFWEHILMSSGSRWLLRRCSLELIVYGKACRKVWSAGANSQKPVRCLIPHTKWLQRWFLRKCSREIRVYGKACCKVSSAGENSQKSARCSILIHNGCSVDLSENILASSKNVAGQHPLANRCCPATCRCVCTSSSKDPWAKFCVQNDCSVDFGGNLLVSSKFVACVGRSCSRILWRQFTTQFSTDNHDTAGLWECLQGGEDGSDALKCESLSAVTSIESSREFKILWQHPLVWGWLRLVGSLKS